MKEPWITLHAALWSNDLKKQKKIEPVIITVIKMGLESVSAFEDVIGDLMTRLNYEKVVEEKMEGKSQEAR